MPPKKAAPKPVGAKGGKSTNATKSGASSKSGATQKPAPAPVVGKVLA